MLALAVLSTAALAPLAALAAMLAALAVGHHASVVKPRQQQRWRFASGAGFETSIIQVVLMLSAGTVIHRVDARLTLIALAAWAASLFFYGYVLERDRS